MQQTDVDSMVVAESAIRHIKKGAFLTVEADGLKNTMTIGWATIGFCWSRPVFMVAVRDSRHTYSIIEKAADFTVSVPLTDMKEAVGFCGTRSGRDVDKFKACDLKTVPARKVNTPVLELSGIHFECRIIHKSPMDAKYLAPDLNGLYPDKDYHTLYFGEIAACYES